MAIPQAGHAKRGVVHEGDGAVHEELGVRLRASERRHGARGAGPRGYSSGGGPGAAF